MSDMLAALQDQAVVTLRRAARDRLPVDAGLCVEIDRIVQSAYALGQQHSADLAVNVIQEMIGAGDYELEVLFAVHEQLSEAFR